VDLPIEVDVYCSGERCGRSTNIVLDPAKDEVTHLVVKENVFPHIERLVPLEKVAETTPDRIRLKCTSNEFHRLESFLEADFLRTDDVDMMSSSEVPYTRPYWVLPHASVYQDYIALDHENIPLQDVAIHRGEVVYATDGKAGKVDEFVVNPESGHITHLVLRCGHLWDQRDITVPVENVDRMEEDGIYLKLDMESLRMFPSVRVRHKWLWPFQDNHQSTFPS
jgi:sporulation protein YlmC with PRC-barrel domain